MRCQKCQNEEASVYITGTKAVRPQLAGKSISGEFALNLCIACAEEYHCTQLSQTLFPHLHEKQITEQFRIISVSTERTLFRLIRTETSAMPEDLSLLTSRVPTQPVGTEITMIFTQSELEWMKGERELI